MTKQTRPVSKYFAPPSTIIADGVVTIIVIVLLGLISWAGAGMLQAFNPPSIEPSIRLDPQNLPYYAARSTLRMFIALGASLLVTLIYGSLAAKFKFAEVVLIPLLDVLQSVPVLGFLSVSVSGFIAMFPGSLLGLECASIFAIFTGQVWNMTFSFYYSLKALPKELEQTSALFRLSKMEKFFKVELPSGAIGLVWNGMVSFGGGWFFVAASEAISVLNRNYMLPGIGSYVTMAVASRNISALSWAIVAISVVLILVDQLFWKPLVAWSDRFRFDKTGGSSAPTSWVYELLKASRITKAIKMFSVTVYRSIHRYTLTRPNRGQVKNHNRRWKWVILRHQVLWGVILGIGLCFGAQFIVNYIGQEVPFSEVILCFKYGIFTFLRVLALVTISTLIWTPLGVAIGFNPRLARFAQPMVQFLVCFPANFVFPIATIIFIKFGISLNWGSLVLMSLGAQWYILFNAIAGASLIPHELREMTANMRLSRVFLWKKLIGPGIFPTWVTGAITASGGAWNASIVSEIVSWGNTTLTAQGLGAYVAKATTVGDWPRIALGVSMMCIFVVAMNRLLWKKMYLLAEERYRIG